jgi:hypothetical protein
LSRLELPRDERSASEYWAMTDVSIDRRLHEMAEIVIAVEKHYTINELCDLLNMSFSTVRLLVKDEPGVLRFHTSKGRAAARTRTMYRVPESVVQRILRRSTNPEKLPTRAVSQSLTRLAGTAR